MVDETLKRKNASFRPLEENFAEKGTRNKKCSSVISCIYMKGTFPEKMNENKYIRNENLQQF